MQKTTIEQENENLRKENQLLKQLGTRQGFFNYYFNQLPRFTTKKECFESINDIYKSLYGEKRYEDYESFRIIFNRTLK